MVQRVQLLQRQGVRHASKLHDALQQATALLPASSLGAADPEPEATPAQA